MSSVLSPEVLGRTLAQAPDPEMARVQLSRVGEHPAAREALARPEVLPHALMLLGFSSAAADFFSAHPEELGALADVRPRTREELDAELSAAVERSGLEVALRRFRHRAMFRVAARDLAGSPFEEVVAEITAVAEACLAAAVGAGALAVVGMALHHRICHVLGGTYGLAHGEVNSVILPHAARFNEPAAPEALRRAALAMGVEDAAEGLFDLAASIGSPTSLAALGMNEKDLEEAARMVVDPPPWNPRPVEPDEVLVLLRDAYRGRLPTRQASAARSG